MRLSYPGSSVSVMEAMAAGLPLITTAQPWLVKEMIMVFLSRIMTRHDRASPVIAMAAGNFKGPKALDPPSCPGL